MNIVYEDAETQLKKLCNVNIAHILGKLRLIFFPYTQTGAWERRVININNKCVSFESPRNDIFAPDACIPVVAIILNAVLACVSAEDGETYDYTVFGAWFSYSLAFLAIAVFLFKIYMYARYEHHGNHFRVFDVLFYMGYVFVGILCLRGVNMVFGPFTCFAAFLYIAANITVFMVNIFLATERAMHKIENSE